MRLRSWIVSWVVGAGVALAAIAPTVAMTSTVGASGWAGRDAEVTVVHGIPGVAVDVYIDGRKALTDFTFGTVTPEIALEPGLYRIAIRPYEASPWSKPILAAREWLGRGENATIAADLSTTGSPELTVFDNPTRALPMGDARVIVRHLAEAPAVDVYAGTSKIVSDLTNPHQAVLTIPAASNVPVSVDAAGTTTTVIGPVTLSFKAGTTTIVYAIGSLAGDTLTAVVQTY